MTVTEPAAVPATQCRVCGQRDTAPKHQVHVGVAATADGGRLFHEHDYDRDGCFYIHFDCDDEWHDLHTKLGVHDDPDAHAARMATADVHAAIVAKCKEGLKNDELRQWIVNLNPRGGAGGIDQTRATTYLAAISKNTATSTVGTETYTFPQHLRVMTANGSDTANGTEQATSAGYTAGGAALSFAAASAGSVSTNAAVSWTNFPSCTSPGMEQWDTSATPLRLFWAPWTGGNITIAAGNTFTVASGSLSDSLA